MGSLLMRNVSFSYLDGFVLHRVNLEVKAGEMVALLGPNGSGKTTLLKLADGVLTPKEGEVLLTGRSLRKLSRREIAQRVAVVPQYLSLPFAFRVEEVVMLGRTPFIKFFSADRDHWIVKHALQLTEMEDFKARSFNELSGGERQKVILAMALAQQPKLLLLDEPTTHLDISHQVEILQLVRNLNEEQRTTIVAAMHDLNLASLYFRRLIILKEGRIFADGTPKEVLTPHLIQEVFSASVQVQSHPLANVPHVVVLPVEKTTK